MKFKITSLLTIIFVCNYARAFSSRISESNFNPLKHIPKEPMGYLYGPNDLENEIKAVEQVLKWYNNRLKSFISVNGLNIQGFGRFSEALGKDLADIGRWIEFLQPVETLSAQWEFAHQMFKVMENARKVLHFYDKDNTSQSLLRWFVHFEVHLLTFYNIQGKPDPEIPNYETMLDLLSRTFSFWRAVCEDLFKKSPDMNLMFEFYFKQAEARFEVLKGGL